MAAEAGSDTPHLPIPAPIDAYGNGGFRFGGKSGGLSHRGSLLCFPDGIWAWPVTSVAELTEASLASVFAHAGSINVFLIGGGRDPFALPAHLRALFRAHAIAVDTMATEPAVRTYNILLAEDRRAGAGLIAVD